MKTTLILPNRLLDAASTESDRLPLVGALVDAVNRTVAVCNGRILVCIPIPGDAPVKPAYITPQKWKSAKGKVMLLDFAAGKLNGLPLDPPDINGNFPDWKKVVPDFDPCYSVKMRPDLITHLGNAMGCGKGDQDGLIFEFGESARSPVRVSLKDATAILMTVGYDGGLADKDSSAMATELAALKKQLSERSDNVPHPAVASSAADASLIESLKDALHESRAECREATARMVELERAIASRPAAQGSSNLTPTPAGKPAAKATKTPTSLATERPTLTRNTERDGIELRFNGKPDEATLTALKARNWRWLPSQPGQPWAKKYTEEEYLFAQGMATGSAFTPMPEPEDEAEVSAATNSEPSPANAKPEGWGRSYLFPSSLGKSYVPEPQPEDAPVSRVRKIILPDF